MLLALAIHIEIFLGSEGGHGGLSQYVFGFSKDMTVPEGGTKTKDKVQPILHDEIFCQEEFHDGVGGLLGSHSFRKVGSEEWLSPRGEGSLRTEEDTQTCFLCVR